MDAYPVLAKLKCRPTYTPACTGLLPRSFHCSPVLRCPATPRTAKCPKPLCPVGVLPRQGWRSRHRGRNSPSLLAPPGFCASPHPSVCLWRYASGKRAVQVAVRLCGAWDLPDVLAAPLSLRAWPPPPAALVVHFPVSSHTTSACPTCGPGRRLAPLPCSDCSTAAHCGAAVMRACARPPVCWPLRSLLPQDTKDPGPPWRFHPSLSRFVTSPCPGYARRPHRAIDGRGLAPLKMRSLVGCSPNAGAQLRPKAGATQERTL